MKRLVFEHPIGFCAAARAFRQPEVRLVVASLALVVASVGMTRFALAADALPSQDQALARALENHPDIVAAKAKVALAEAELYGKRMEVSRQVLGLYGGLKTLDAEIDAAKSSLAAARADFERTNKAAADGTAVQSVVKMAAAAVQLAEGKLVVATGQREQAEKELRLLIGTAPRFKWEGLGIETATPARQEPQGPIMDTWKAKAEQPIKLSFADTPLSEVLNFLSEKTGIKFSMQQYAFDEIGFRADEPISLSTNEVPLSAALQGLEDAYPSLQFVLRDYGVLLTTEESAQEHGYKPIVERADPGGLGSKGGGGGLF
jgi:hypothetical protein